MTEILLPALDGRDALGFLAALGAFRLCTEELADDVRLRFDRETARAVLSADSLADLRDVVELVSEVFARLDDGQVPDLPDDFPPPGEAPDRLRVRLDDVRALPDRWEGRADPNLMLRWLRALITDLAADDKGRTAITPYAAPSGKQSFSTMFSSTRDAVRARSSAFHEAFAGWRRVAGCTGEYLDHRVLVSAADAGDGRTGQERGVPGATWLALMALPLLPVTLAAGRALAVGWQVVGRRPVLRWPLWDRPLDTDGAAALLSHPALMLEEQDGELRLGDSERERLRCLNVFAVACAERRRIEGRNFAGVLVPRVTIACGR